MKIIKGDLILTEDTTFTESIKVEGNIKGYYNLKVAGNINAWDINARNIDAWDINAGDIDARNIDAWDINAGDIDVGNINARDINAGNINARDIDAMDIICEKRIKAEKEYKTICRVFVQNKFSLERKEQMKWQPSQNLKRKLTK